MSIHDKAILIRCSISTWDATVRDNTALDSFLAQHKMSSDAGSMYKHLIAKTALKPVREAVNNIRTYHRNKTIPWDLDGVGLLPNSKLLDYMAGMRMLKDAFKSAVDNFLTHYDVYISDAIQRLGDRYREDEFPSRAHLESRFAVVISPLPIPKSDHILADLTDTGLDKSLIDKAVKEAENRAMEKLWAAIYTRLNHIQRTLSDPNRVFRSTLITKLDDYIDKLRDFNVYNSDDLNSIIQFIETRITSQNAEEIRKFPEARAHVLRNIEAAIIACKPFIGDGYASVEEEDDEELKLAA